MACTVSWFASRIFFFIWGASLLWQFFFRRFGAFSFLFFSFSVTTVWGVCQPRGEQREQKALYPPNRKSVTFQFPFWHRINTSSTFPDGISSGFAKIEPFKIPKHTTSQIAQFSKHERKWVIQEQMPLKTFPFWLKCVDASNERENEKKLWTQNFLLELISQTNTNQAC